MTAPLKQHLIDPELCIRCYTCEDMCTRGAISHDDENVVVDAALCDGCMDCIMPCPTGSIDNWRVVAKPYSVDEQFGWLELPAQEELASGGDETALDDSIAALLEAAHAGAGGLAVAPPSASQPATNLFPVSAPATATIQGNFRLTEEGSDTDIRHIILNLGDTNLPVLEGQTIGITPPGLDANGKPFMPRLYSISSPRDGERPNTNNLSLTVKRDEQGVCSNYLCDLQKGAEVLVSGPFGTSFLMPDDPQAKLIMICTGTGSAPFRAFTMRHQRVMPQVTGALHLFFGARSDTSLPYFGPLTKIPQTFLAKHFAFSRDANAPRQYVQDRLRAEQDKIGALLSDPATHIYLCGLKDMEQGVDAALTDIAQANNLIWAEVRDHMRETGRYHVETY